VRKRKKFHTLKVLFGIYTLDKWVEKEECLPTETGDSDGALQITHMKQLWVPMSSPCLQNLLLYKDKQRPPPPFQSVQEVQQGESQMKNAKVGNLPLKGPLQGGWV